MSSAIQRLPSESFWMPSKPPRPTEPERSVTVDGKFGVTAYVGAAAFSVVSRIRFAHGSHVLPSMFPVGLTRPHPHPQLVYRQRRQPLVITTPHPNLLDTFES